MSAVLVLVAQGERAWRYGCAGSTALDEAFTAAMWHAVDRPDSIEVIAATGEVWAYRRGTDTLASIIGIADAAVYRIASSERRPR